MGRQLSSGDEQTLYMAILGVAWHIDWSGGGVHNWNLTFFDFVKILYVSKPAECEQ